jgi:hypothetical protein
MYSSQLLPANKFPPHYASQTIRRSGAPPYMKTCLDTFTEVNTFDSTRAREFVIDLETDTELRGQTMRFSTHAMKAKEEGMWGAEPLPLPAPINRNVLKWLQSLDLSHSVRNIRRDLANGFLVAEICSRYYPNEIKMHSFQNCSNTEQKVDNWRQLKEFFKENELKIPKPMLEGVIKGRHGAAVEFVEKMYELYTGKKVQQQPELNPKEQEEASGLAGKFASNRKNKKAPVDPKTILPGLTANSKMLSKAMPAPPLVKFGEVQLTPMASMSAAKASLQRQRG